MKLLVGICGASGALYAQRLLMALAPAPGVDVACSFSPNGRAVWTHELGDAKVPCREIANNDFTSCFASGSARWDAVVLSPCSAARLGRIAHGVSDDLIGRAADVAIKERRRLVLVLRETPLSLIHLQNMVTVVSAGAVVLPAMPSFYTRPSTVESVVDTVVARALDQLGLDIPLSPRWGGKDDAT